MKIINLKENKNYLEEYIVLCSKEWGSSNESREYINSKIDKMNNTDKYISVLGLVDNNELLGFISLFKSDGDYFKELTPWYATMYVKKEYRGKGYSKILNEAIINEADRLGYKKIYLKTDLVNYYEKFGAVKIDSIPNGEYLYYMEIKKD